MKSNCPRPLYPAAFKSKISGVIVAVSMPGELLRGKILLNVSSEYRRKHMPGWVRPARPARCWAEAWEMGAVARVFKPARGLNPDSLHNPMSVIKCQLPRF